ncbi:MAG TPA: proline iminopeptidase-family hydrolase [Trebonia sp.]|nr:proline iminopeptidase-family hydrolase [Trebonia sp.]
MTTAATEGTVEFTTSHHGRDETHQTWYKIVGPDSRRPPLITLHGGPGATHDYLLSVADLAGDRPVVFYDQLGNGKSTHLPDRGAGFWTVDLFVRELRNLVARLGITRHHVLGQSWGGFLAQEYALTRPDGLAAMVLADTAASFPEFLAECDRLRALLPPAVEETLRRHEDAGTTDDPGYLAACDVFYRRHVCRLADWPPEVTASFAHIDADPTVYHTMNGPSEFHVIGSIKDWQVKDRLPEISGPVLLVSGRHDEAGPAVQRTLLDGLPTVEWTVFGDSSHMPHWEERDRYMEVVGSWLRQHE